MKTKQLFYLLILPLLFFLTSCEGKFKDWSPQKIEAYIAENFPIGTNRKKIESFLDEQKLSYDWHEQYKILGCFIRERSGFDFINKHRVFVKFYFDDKNSMIKFKVVPGVTGPFIP